MSNPASIPVLPPQYKTLNHCLKIASEHDVRDPVVAYWCRFYAVQQGLAIDKSSAEARAFLLALMDWLEKRKKELADNEAITNEAVAEAHIENYALRIFNWADGQDRAGIFNKNVIKTFYTAGILIDVLTNFNKGELSEDLVGTRKYAKWKAAYINNCLKNGETPHAGPLGDGDSEDNEGNYDQSQSGSLTQPSNPAPPTGAPGGFWPTLDPSNLPPSASAGFQPPPSHSPGPPAAATASSYTAGGNFAGNVYTGGTEPTTKGPVSLSVSEIVKAQKYCKWAESALNFEDVPTAITNLERALNLLKTGRDEC